MTDQTRDKSARNIGINLEKPKLDKPPDLLALSISLRLCLDLLILRKLRIPQMILYYQSALCWHIQGLTCLKFRHKSERCLERRVVKARTDAVQSGDTSPSPYVVEYM